MIITLTKKHLVAAFQKVNQDYLDHPDNYGEVDGTEETAESQASHVLGKIPDGTMLDVKADIQTEVVAEFNAFCKDLKGLDIPEELYEEFFGA